MSEEISNATFRHSLIILEARSEEYEMRDEEQNFLSPASCHAENIRSYVFQLEQENEDLRKRCKYNLDRGAQITCWDEYEVVKQERDILKTKLSEALIRMNELKSLELEKLKL